MTAFSEQHFEKKLAQLKDTQESIQSLSSWCLQHRSQHKKIVSCWLRVLKKVKVEHRLTLFYLANDVIQYSKRKNYEFVESWGTALQRATPMVRIEKVKHRILRIFKIWGERGVYDEAFITDLTGLLSTATKKPTAEPAVEVEFQPPLLIAKVRACMKLENDTDLKLKRLNESPLSFSDAEALRSHLKDRRQGDDMVSEVDEGIAKMQLYVNALDSELKERASLIDLLDQAEGFYNSQNGEAKIVATAYKNFGSRVKLLKRRLDEIIPTLKDSSPVPSPDVNAPSPSPSGGSEFELPGEELLKGDEQFPSSFLSDVQPIQQIRMVTQEDSQSLDNCFASFMGNSLPFDLQKNLFGVTSSPEVPLTLTPPLPIFDDHGELPLLSGVRTESEGKPIEVINSRSKPEEGFNISDFFKSLTSNIPGLDMDPPLPSIPSPPISLLKLVEDEPTTFTESEVLDPPPSNQYSYLINTISPNPLPPPPPPPDLFPLEESQPYKYSRAQEGESAWNTKLPPKFPTWGDAPDWELGKSSEWMPAMPLNKVDLPLNLDLPLSLDTPESPPLFEKEGFSDPVEYDDSDPLLMSSNADVDHRTLVPLPLEPPPLPKDHPKDTDQRTLMHIPPATPIKKDVDHRQLGPRKKDVDHRNLISLTGSPLRELHPPLAPPPTPPNLNWPRGDQDYRTIPKSNPFETIKAVKGEGDQDYRIPPSRAVGRKCTEELQDNVESVDMEMSDDEALEPMAIQTFTSDGNPGRKKLSFDREMEAKRNNKPVISFNINSPSKVLVDSPLNEKEETKRRPSLLGIQKIPTIGGDSRHVRPRGSGSNHSFNRPPPSPHSSRGFRPLLIPPPLPLQMFADTEGFRIPPPQLNTPPPLIRAGPPNSVTQVKISPPISPRNAMTPQGDSALPSQIMSSPPPQMKDSPQKHFQNTPTQIKNTLPPQVKIPPLQTKKPSQTRSFSSPQTVPPTSSFVTTSPVSPIKTTSVILTKPILSSATQIKTSLNVQNKSTSFSERSLPTQSSITNTNVGMPQTKVVSNSVTVIPPPLSQMKPALLPTPMHPPSTNTNIIPQNKTPEQSLVQSASSPQTNDKLTKPVKLENDSPSLDSNIESAKKEGPDKINQKDTSTKNTSQQTGTSESSLKKGDVGDVAVEGSSQQINAEQLKEHHKNLMLGMSSENDPWMNDDIIEFDQIDHADHDHQMEANHFNNRLDDHLKPNRFNDERDGNNFDDQLEMDSFKDLQEVDHFNDEKELNHNRREFRGRQPRNRPPRRGFKSRGRAKWPEPRMGMEPIRGMEPRRGMEIRMGLELRRGMEPRRGMGPRRGMEIRRGMEPRRGAPPHHIGRFPFRPPPPPPPPPPMVHNMSFGRPPRGPFRPPFRGAIQGHFGGW